MVDWSLSWPVCRRVSQAAAWWEYCWPLCWRAASHNRSSLTCPKFDRWFGRLVRCSASRLLAGRVVARWFGWSVRWSVGPLIGQWVGKLVVWLVARSINRLVDWWVTGLVGRLVDHTAVKRLRMCGQCIELVACFQTFRTNLSRSRKLQRTKQASKKRCFSFFGKLRTEWQITTIPVLEWALYLKNIKLSFALLLFPTDFYKCFNYI